MKTEGMGWKVWEGRIKVKDPRIKVDVSRWKDQDGSRWKDRGGGLEM